MTLEELWNRKESLRNEWRNNREDIVLQLNFGRANKEWKKRFLGILMDNGIEVSNYNSTKAIYRKVEENRHLGKQELISMLSLFLDERFVNKITIDL